MKPASPESPFPWATLPPPLAAMLLAGLAGRQHLEEAAGLAQAAAGAANNAELAGLLAEVGLLCLGAAFEEESANGLTAAALLRHIEAHPELAGRIPAPTRALLAALARAFSLPGSTAYYRRLADAGDAKRLMAFLDNECKSGRHRLFWLNLALRQAVLERDFAFGQSLVSAVCQGELAPVGDKLRGDLAWFAGDPDTAQQRYQAAQAAAPFPAGLARRAFAAKAAGRRELAVDILASVLAAHPGHVTALLALSDLAAGLDNARAPLAGRLVIGLYTYAKAAEIDRTLASLFASDIGDAKVLVLDNASPDATPDALAAWADRVGPERLTVITLPTNIGAPAARNWLLARPEARAADFVAYLDDDVLLPADWLGRLGAAAAAYPEAGVWGCRVLDAANPAIAQGIGLAALPQRPAVPDAPAPEAFRMTEAHAQGFDAGAFAHLRPCLSVMGCCHLFRREILDRCGEFDIRFSPSQYDDVDHDWRLALLGRLPVYQGHLAVAHLRPAPVYKPAGPAQAAAGEANKAKLFAKHRDRFGEITEASRQALLADIEAKTERLSGLGLLSR